MDWIESELETLKREKVIAIMRGIEQRKAIRAGVALAAGGIRFLEVTLNTPNALSIIATWREKLPSDVHIGAGTVLTTQMVYDAVSAGATFLIAPDCDREVIEAALERKVQIWPGALTPTEISMAFRTGVAAVKVFPSDLFGPQYFRSLRGPFDQMAAIAVGGITPDNMTDYLDAGAIAVAFGSHLFHPDSIANEDWKQIEQRGADIVSRAKLAK